MTKNDYLIKYYFMLTFLIQACIEKKDKKDADNSSVNVTKILIDSNHLYIGTWIQIDKSDSMKTYLRFTYDSIIYHNDTTVLYNDTCLVEKQDKNKYPGIEYRIYAMNGDLGGISIVSLDTIVIDSHFKHGASYRYVRVR